MPFDARQVLASSPTAVSVHDHGDMAGDPGKIQLIGQALFFAARLNEAL
jgi:hypothetical protein